MPPRRRPTANPETTEPAMAQMLALMQQQMAFLTQQQQQQQQQQPQQPPPVPVVSFKTFQGINPPEFRGSSNPIEARAWLKEIEKAFALTRVGEDQKTEYASYFLKGEANFWWESKRALEREAIVSWERFTELFLEKNFPRYMQDHMEVKFLEFKCFGVRI